MRLLHNASELGPVHGCVLVPTMGALHEGHRALIQRAVSMRDGRPVVVWVFVNPTQFNEATDFERYPRTLDADVALCGQAGADAVFAPTPEVIYPPGETVPTPALPDVADGPGLEDRFRPGHFAGVCQVVRRFFDLLRPSAALFGEKDWQQLQTIRAMTERDGLGVEIVGHATVREADGLAMSSRNRLLTSSERAAAGAIPAALCDACAEPTAERAEHAMRRRLEAAGLRVEYAAVRDCATLRDMGPAWTGPGRALIAARTPSVRLIDNAPWPR